MPLCVTLTHSSTHHLEYLTWEPDSIHVLTCHCKWRRIIWLPDSGSFTLTKSIAIVCHLSKCHIRLCNQRYKYIVIGYCLPNKYLFASASVKRVKNVTQEIHLGTSNSSYDSSDKSCYAIPIRQQAISYGMKAKRFPFLLNDCSLSKMDQMPHCFKQWAIEIRLRT